jgi:LacI family transcriptional regulator
MSLKKIADMTGLSIATVSHAINGTRAVSRESRDLVEAAAKEIGYKPNIAARMLRTQKSGTIALIIPGSDANPNAGYFYMDVIMGIRRKMVESNHELIISSYDPQDGSERSLNALQILKKQWIDGIILVPSANSRGQIEVIRELGLPFVLLDRRDDDDECSCVDSDNEGGAREAVNLLAACGWKRIGFVGGNLATSTGRQRYNGYTAALAHQGKVYDESLVRICNGFSMLRGMECAAELLANKADALFVADNTMMLGAVRWLNEHGVAIPGQIGIVGYDDFEWMEMMNPPITTVKQKAHQMGYTAADMLFGKCSGEQSNEKIVLGTSLVIRKSHGTLR